MISKVIESFYFHPYRNIGKSKHLAIFAAVFTILFAAAAFHALNDYKFGPVFYSWRWPVILFVLLIFAVFISRHMWSYKKTNMMLRPDGAGVWSIHMGPLASALPFYYARTPLGFIASGTVDILTAASAAKFKGKIVLESHLFGSQASRLAEIARLSAIFPIWHYSQRISPKPLGEFNARRLTKLRAALLKHHNKKIPAPLSKYNPIGIIEITI